MNKLRKKIFWTLFSILSIFSISILILFHSQHYHLEKAKIEQNLRRMNNIWKEPNKKEDFPKPDVDNLLKEPIDDENHRKFMDATIYTILLNNDNQIVEIISHTEDGNITDAIEKEALKIIQHANQNKIEIGNLYFKRYSYKYIKSHYIILIDNQEVSKRLLSSLKITLLLFLFAEIVIIIVSKILSEWIIKPIENTFQKQKQFIADASHELKTPLSVIMACADTLEHNPKEQKWITHIKNESERMNHLITSLLVLAKVEDGTNKQLFESVHLSKLVEKSVLPFESLTYEKNITLDYEIEENIYFKCNTTEMQKLLSILLDNAIEHSSKQGHIIVKLRQEKNIIVLEVANKGIPIPPNEREKIFERFYRGDPSRNRNENRYGMGLAIAKAITQNHNGNISVSSYHGYTIFKIILKNKEH